MTRPPLSEIPVWHGSSRSYFVMRTIFTETTALLESVLDPESDTARSIAADDARRAAECARLGHQLTRTWWRLNDPMANDPRNGLGEWHVGCTRCSLFWTEPEPGAPPFELAEAIHHVHRT